MTKSVHVESALGVRKTATEDTVGSILRAKGNQVWQIEPSATVYEALSQMAERSVGALPVVSDGVLVGIITERDILYCCVAGSQPLSQVKVDEAMSTTLITGTPDDEVEHVMGLMTTHRIRHLPVLCEGRLAGMISIGDVVKAQHDRLAMENRFMKDYIAG